MSKYTSQYSFITGLNPLQINMQTFPLRLQFVMQKKVKGPVITYTTKRSRRCYLFIFCVFDRDILAWIYFCLELNWWLISVLLIDFNLNMQMKFSDSVQLSCLIGSDSLDWLHRLQHTRLPCPSPAPGACSNSCPFESVMPSNHLILRCPLLLLPSIFPSISVVSNEAVLIRWLKHWSFSFSISPSNEHSGLTSFRMDCLHN